MAHTFILSDESVNSYGFWVKTTGIDLSQFKKNPVMLYDHRQYSLMPIGKWTNIRVEDGKLLADAEFDQDDEFAVSVEKKVEKGHLRGASIGFNVLELSEDKKDLKPGQTRSTVTKSIILEASITPFPSNRNSLKILNANGELVELSANKLNSIIPKISEMDEVKLKLGLPETASESDIVNALSILLDAKADNEQKITNLSEQRNELFVKLGLQTGSITDENKEKMLKLANTDFELALDFVGKKSAQKTTETQNTQNDDVRLSDVIAEMRKQNAKPQKTYRELAETEPETLQKLHDENIEEFKRLYKAEYGKEYKD